MLLAASSVHDVWVLTQPHMAEETIAALRELPEEERVTVVPVGPRMPRESQGLGGLTRYHVAHDRWQRNAGLMGLELHGRIGFDVVHHATLAAYWTRIGVSVVPAPLVVGPVGGAVEPPRSLLFELGAKGIAEAVVRTMARRLIASVPVVRRSRAGATITLVQNRETARAVGGTAKVLTNALCVDESVFVRAGRRRPTVVHASRLIPWKATRLAVEAMRHVHHPDAHLHIFGTGPERQRVERAIARWGLKHRVTIEGQVPRKDLLLAISESSVLLHPSLHDEGGTVVAEALTLGVPVVCLDWGGPAEVVRQWPQLSTDVISPSRPRATARALGAAIDARLAAPPPPAKGAFLPQLDFDTAILRAYDEAVAVSSTRM